MSATETEQRADLLDDLKDHMIGTHARLLQAHRALEWGRSLVLKRTASVNQVIDAITTWWDSTKPSLGHSVADKHTLLAVIHWVEEYAGMGS